ncbi:MAG: hypothetical protein OJF59_000079 [Cytophagales bacterium]|nr:MAG: hypothetical protein OJF59_000079 [Cytophagales bacterium]
MYFYQTCAWDKAQLIHSRPTASTGRWQSFLKETKFQNI